MSETKMKSVFNKGQRTYITSVGQLHPKQSVTVPEGEAKLLMDYMDIVDLDKVAPKASAQMRELEAENDKLKTDLAQAKADTKPPEKQTHKKEAEPKEPVTATGKGGKKGRK